MSVALVIRDTTDSAQRLVPIAPQEVFRSTWLPGARELGLEWVDLMETGFDVTTENRASVLDELTRIREWMQRRGDVYQLERLNRLIAEVDALQFDAGATAFIG